MAHFSVSGDSIASLFIVVRIALEAHTFRRASLSENCSLLGTDEVRGQISEYIFAPNGGYCLYNSILEC